MRAMLQPLTRRDTLQPSEAIVVLSSGITLRGEPTEGARRRLQHAYSLLRLRLAPRLVVTHLPPPLPSYVPTVRRDLRRMHIATELEEVGPIHDTHDEALAVAQRAREQGWNRIVLVSDGTHLRRAKALFEKCGLQVLCSPGTTPAQALSRAAALEIRGLKLLEFSTARLDLKNRFSGRATVLVAAMSTHACP